MKLDPSRGRSAPVAGRIGSHLVPGLVPVARRRAVRLALPVALLVALVGVGAAKAGSWLVVPHPADAVAYDAVLVLGSHEQDRLPAAHRLAEAHPDAVVVLARPARPTAVNCYDCEHHVQRLIGWGLPPGRVVVMEAGARNSFDELAAVARLAESRGWSSVAVVTSAYHTRRVRGLARHVARQHQARRFSVVSADEPGIRPRRWWTRGYDRRYVRYEAAALVVNSWRYGVWPWEWLQA